MTRLKTWRSRGAQFMLALAAAMAAGSAAQAQDIPAAVSPLRVESDHNGVNLTTGRTTIPPPVLSVPGAPNLRFDRVQNAAPYVVGKKYGQAGEYPTSNWTVHTGQGSAESFQCVDVADCTSVTGTGSYFRPNATFRQAGTAANWHFTRLHVNTTGNPGTYQAYASSVTYPTGETISYAYDTAYLTGDPFNRTFYRPNLVSSNNGYAISITYQGNDFNGNPTAWATPSVVTIYAIAAPGVPLGRLTYVGNTITDLAGRVYTCTGCSNSLGSNIETTAGSLTLPTDGTPAVQVTAAPTQALVASVVRDGVQYNYTYTYNGGAPSFHAPTNSYWYTRLVVTGPNGFNQTYNFVISSQRVVMTSMVDSIGRTTSYQFDPAYRPTRVTSPEGNYVNVLYDEHANVVSRTTTPKAGSGLTAVTATASFPYCDTIISPQVTCFRPTWSRDALGRQTDYVYNSSGQMTEQTDPADANGVRRRTYTEYAVSPAGISRKSVVRICGVGTTCGTNQEIRTEYQYWGDTNLPTLERRIDGATGQVLDTINTYDGAGRLTSTDGPLPGNGDAIYSHYDVLGRKIWAIGALGANGLRSAQRYAYRSSDDEPMSIEQGSVTDPLNPVLTVQSRNDIAYDARRNAIRETMSANGTTYNVTQRTFDLSNRVECEVRRMNPAVFASLPASACTLSTTSPTYGPDRISRNLYDNAGQLLTEQRAYGVTTANGFPATLQQNYATYSYSLNGKRTSLTDANGNRAEMTYDGFDRQRRWIFPSTTVPGLANQADYEEYGYDLVGNRTSYRKRDGSTLTYQYDNLNRMIVKIVPERAGLDPSNTRDVYYAYNLRDLQTEARFDSLAGDGVSNAYDLFGRMTSTTSRTGALVRVLTFAYDTGSRRTSITHPDGTAFTYGYSAANELTGLYSGYGTAVPLETFTYNAQGRLASRAEGGGSNVSYGYDPMGRLNSQTDMFTGGTGNVTLGFSHNPVGQIIQRTRSNDAYASNTAYNVSRNYTANGLNQYTTAGSAGFTYDANGNLTSDGTNTYTYDVENRLVARSGGVSLGYDPLGRLAWTTGSPNFTRFLYDGDALVAEYDYNGTLTARYVHGSNATADDPLIWYDGATARWLHADHQGSIVAVTNGATGQVYAINGYDSWGIPNAANVGRFQYTGQAWLAELGMYYYKARIYSPTLGRFLQTDPVGYQDQVNLYAYVGNDPINRIDPSGTRELKAEEETDLRRVFGDRMRMLHVIRLPIINRSFITPLFVNFAHGDYSRNFSTETDASRRETFWHEFYHVFENSVGIKSWVSMLGGQVGSGFSNRQYAWQPGVPFAQQNFEARAQAFGVCMASGNCANLEGMSIGGRGTTLSFKDGQFTLRQDAALGSRIPRVTHFQPDCKEKNTCT